MDPEQPAEIQSEEDLSLMEDRFPIKVDTEEEGLSRNEISRSTHCSDDERKIKREVKRDQKSQSLKKTKLKLMAAGTLLLQIQRAIESYFSDEALEERPESEGFLPIKTIIAYSRVADLLLPIQSTQEKIEVVRRALTRHPRSKLIQLTADRNQISKRMHLDTQDSALYDSRTVYYEGISGSSEQIAQYLQKHFQSPPVHVQVEGEAYGFLVFANEQQAVEMVSSFRLRNAPSQGKSRPRLTLEKVQMMFKKDYRAQQSLYQELLKEMTAQYEMQHIFPAKDEPSHQCHPSNPFARVLGLSSRISLLNLKQAIMHYEDPVDIQHAQDEAIIRFPNRSVAKLFLGKCGSLNIFGEKLQVEEIKMDEAFELLSKQLSNYPHSAPTSQGGSRAVSRTPSRLVSRVASPSVFRSACRLATHAMSRVQSEDEESEVSM